MDYYASDCELVLALVCPVGVNLEDVNSRLQSIFNQFSYQVNLIHLSEIFKSLIGSVGHEPNSDEVKRLDAGMEGGNKLRRETERNDIMALLAVNEINKKRNYEDEQPEPLKRCVHIIRSLKHPDEAETLRQVYGPGFFLLAISSTVENRKKYFTTLKGISDQEEIERLIARDDKESDDCGQQTRKVFELADAFVTTDGEETLEIQLARVVDLLFSNPYISPTQEEYAMFMAYSASLRSADLARQVGAVILNQYGDIISAGANDVPKYGGGLYWPDGNDKRDYKVGFDSNEKEKIGIVEDIVHRLNSKASEDDVNDAIWKLRDSKLMRNITEYGRSVHAEMEAITASARNGVSVRGGRLYTTTYPCHNCAKHIVAAGIKEVIFIEPYPKSYATSLYSDTINDDGELNDGKVNFRQFTGIGPRRFVDLFSMRLSSGRSVIRKEKGEIISWRRNNAELRVPMTPLSYLDAEVSLVRELEDFLRRVNHG